MVISREGTFDYVFKISSTPLGRTQGSVREPVPRDQRRLVGHAPILVSGDYQREPWQLYARITLAASDRRALASVVSFSVDRALLKALRTGDVLHLNRTGCGGMGLSILRDNHLVAAAGAITHVPLGADVSARAPSDLTQQAEAVFQTRDPQYHLQDQPIELTIQGETRILHIGRPQMGPYEVFMRHGFMRGIPGTDESVSIERRGVCPDTAAHTTAQLLAEGVQISDH
jgi:hypothetical protein